LIRSVKDGIVSGSNDLIATTTNAALQTSLIPAFAQMNAGTTSPVTAGALALAAARLQLGITVSDAKNPSVPAATVVADAYTFLSDVTLAGAAAAFAAGSPLVAKQAELLATAESDEAVLIKNHALIAKEIDTLDPHIGNNLLSVLNDVRSAFNNFGAPVIRGPTGFDGDEVRLATYAPSIAPKNQVVSGTATVAEGTTTFPNFTALTRGPNIAYSVVAASLAVSGDTMTFLYPASTEGHTFAGGAFNGYVLTEVKGPNVSGNIVGATLTSTDIPGLTQADLSFTPTSVALNVSGLTLPRLIPGAIDITVDFASHHAGAAALIAHSVA
jgi:hypothetical protein